VCVENVCRPQNCSVSDETECCIDSDCALGLLCKESFCIKR
jgi:hypothetical protein